MVEFIQSLNLHFVPALCDFHLWTFTDMFSTNLSSTNVISTYTYSPELRTLWFLEKTVLLKIHITGIPRFTLLMWRHIKKLRKEKTV